MAKVVKSRDKGVKKVLRKDDEFFLQKLACLWFAACRQGVPRYVAVCLDHVRFAEDDGD
jgi:hypothetical protein